MAATAVRYLRSVGAATVAEPQAVEALPRPDLRAVRPDERLPLDPVEFRRVLGNFASGVTVITSPGSTAPVTTAPGAAAATGPDDEPPAGFACQSFASLSLDPPLVVFMVARTSTTWPRIARAGVFCVNVLGAHQGELCRGFARSGTDKFAGVEYDAAPVTGSPRLAGVPAWIDCTIQTVHTGGDHLIVVGRVEALSATAPDAPESSPLLFHRGAFGGFSGFSA
ncbi:flavin reductase family protein [Streptomyces sp. NBC_00237]|uniref:flavin reductase family protein n=1 Tax=Streptomyces sp. NBC_00237 TaxID=2975687 RepID=UPI002252F520|nr:flavin reductase family protein [Streptomyces sp. NBC_00237]MCX5200544.1 flavin reductase family protein [Streptomyces sp. NBC_00237]